MVMKQIKILPKWCVEHRGGQISGAVESSDGYGSRATVSDKYTVNLSQRVHRMSASIGGQIVDVERPDEPSALGGTWIFFTPTNTGCIRGDEPINVYVMSPDFVEATVKEIAMTKLGRSVYIDAIDTVAMIATAYRKVDVPGKRKQARETIQFPFSVGDVERKAREILTASGATIIDCPTQSGD